MNGTRLCIAVLFVAVSAVPALSAGLNPKEKLGKNIFFDARLSVPAGQACVECHSPASGFNGIGDSNKSVYEGAVAGAFGDRNPPAAAYASYSPVFHYDQKEEMYIGGQFWDGRAATLKEQAKAPFLNPVEQNNPHMRTVVKSVANSNYARLMKKVYGPSIFKNTGRAFDAIADALAAYQSSAEVNRFSSKFDLYQAGKTTLTKQEQEGLDLFNGKGKCAECHPSTPGPYHPSKALFTDYTYDNLGFPRNPDNPFYMSNPKYVDYGLGKIVKDTAQNGKFKVPTLRNIAVAGSYGHNGYFKTLREIVDFYNTRDVAGTNWPPPEVKENLNTEEMGNLGLTDADVDAIVLFLGTLTDGYAPPSPR